MRPLSALELLQVWEQAATWHPIDQAMALLAAAHPTTGRDTLARLTIGQRDGCLLTLREWMFGPRLTSVATCPACGDRLELAFDAADIRVAPPSEPVDHQTFAAGPYETQFRLPNSFDLAAVARSRDVATARQTLLTRCLISVTREGVAIAADQAPTPVVEAVVSRMAELDAQADIQLDLTCPVCQHQWQAAFDIVAFFWSEITAWVQRALRDVHHLALAYGWSETEILALSPWRRQFYLEMIGA